VHSASTHREQARVGAAGETAQVRVYDSKARLVSQRSVTGPVTVILKAGGFAIVSS
jgi:ribosomal protein S28E/S33